MNYGEKIRYFGFSGYDFIRNNSVTRHISELEKIYSEPGSYAHNNRKRLSKLLDHACCTVPYYKPYSHYSSLGDFPVIQKKTVRDNYELFFSGAYNKADLSCVKTSGSYGTPMKYYFTKEKKDRRFAEIIFFNRWAGYEIGMNHALIRARAKSRFLLFAENELLIRPIGIDLSWLENQWQLLNKRDIKFIIGYPSVLKMLAGYCLDNSKQMARVKLKGIISYAEPLYEEDRSLMEEIFKCPVLSRYSSEEFGVIAHECLENRKFHLNNASYVIELLDLENDKPAAQGDPGRVVVTDLFSHAMPLIRYDTGDVALKGDECTCSLNTEVFEKIKGRIAESIYDTRGRLISPLVLVTPISRTLENIRQFQFIQKGKKHYLVRLTVSPSFQKEKVRLIAEKLIKILGEDAQVEFEYVPIIPALPSGKRVYFINEYRDKTNQ